MDRSERRQSSTWWVVAAMAMQLPVWALLVYLFHMRHTGYGFFDVSDVSVYREYAEAFARGRLAFRDVAIEYPPLAIPLMTLPARLPSFIGYDWGFALEMMMLSLPVAGLGAATAARLWPGRRAPLLAGAASAAAVALAGPIVANRFDIAVALLMAACAYCLARRWWWPAAGALGLGFALKLTPAVFLPLVLLLAARRWQVIGCLLAFVVAGALPFLPHLVRGGDGLLFVFSYHGQRPLQIESMLATGHMFAHAVGWLEVTVTTSHGSHGIAAPGAATLAALSPWLLGGGLAALYGVAWRHRRQLRECPGDVPLLVLTMMLVLVSSSKVLSPQFLVWTFPFVALVGASALLARRLLAGGVLGVLLLTQLGFPALYWDLVALGRTPITLLVVRNLVLLEVTAVAVWQTADLYRRRQTEAGRSIPSATAVHADG